MELSSPSTDTDFRKSFVLSKDGGTLDIAFLLAKTGTFMKVEDGMRLVHTRKDTMTLA